MSKHWDIKDREIMNTDGDCSVVALSKAMEIEYMTAYGIMLALGRTNKRGPKVKPFIKFLDTSFKRYPKPHMSVRNYVKYMCSQGNWLIWVRGHIFAVVNGEIKDWVSEDSGKHVEMVWRVK